MSAEKKQVGGTHYKGWKVQPYRLMLGLSGPAAHIAGYLLREKGEDDLQKAYHWCDLAIEAGMMFTQVQLNVPESCVEEWESTPGLISAAEWCWANGIKRDSLLAHALLALAEGDYKQVQRCINALEGERENEQHKEG